MAKKTTVKPAKATSQKQTATKRNSFNVSYLTKEGIRNVWSNRMMSFASVAVLVSCLLIIGLAVLLYANINAALESVQDQSVIMVYLADDISDTDASKAGQDIRMIADVEDASFVSKEQAYQEQLKELGDDAALMEGMTDNPLPDAYRVQLKTLENYDNVVENLKSIANVDSVRGNSDLAGQVRELKNAASIVCIGMIAILLIVSLFIISNTVRVTMYNRRLEISIMKAVGATNWFVRWPFIVEGIVIGIISGLLSEGLVYGLYELTMKAVSGVFSVLGDQPISFGSYAGPMLLCFILVGVLAGTLGSIISMSRYLKEQEGVVDETH